MAGQFDEQDIPEGYTYLTEVPLPPAAMVQGSVTIVSFYDEQGNTRYAWSTRGEMSLAHGLGLVEIVKAHMINGTTFTDRTADD